MFRRKPKTRNAFTDQMSKIGRGSFNTMIKAQAAPHFECTSKGRAVMAFVQVRG